MELIDFLAVCSDNAHITVSDNRCRVLGIGTRQHSRYEAFDIIVGVSDGEA